jgi:hypothetical protein
MDSEIITQYERLKEYCSEYCFKVELRLEGILLKEGDGSIVGKFQTVNEVLYYMHGYAIGFKRGKLFGITKENIVSKE